MLVVTDDTNWRINITMNQTLIEISTSHAKIGKGHNEVLVEVEHIFSYNITKCRKLAT